MFTTVNIPPPIGISPGILTGVLYKRVLIAVTEVYYRNLKQEVELVMNRNDKLISLFSLGIAADK